MRPIAKSNISNYALSMQWYLPWTGHERRLKTGCSPDCPSFSVSIRCAGIRLFGGLIDTAHSLDEVRFWASCVVS